MKNLPAAQTPFDTLTEALGGLMIGHCLTSVANFRVADALGDTPQTAAELAAATGTNPEALRRMLRLLAAHGVFAYSEDRFAHTAASRLLRADHPYSMRNFVAIYGTPTAAEHLGYFDYTLQTGSPTPYKVNLDGFFALLQGDPGLGQLFNVAMTSKARLQIASIVAAYDFSACESNRRHRRWPGTPAAGSAGRGAPGRRRPVRPPLGDRGRGRGSH